MHVLLSIPQSPGAPSSCWPRLLAGDGSVLLATATLLCLGVSAGGAGAEFISLEDAWRIGLRESFTMASARDAFRAADITAFQAQSEFFPKVTPSYFHGPNESGWSVTASQAVPWLGGALQAGWTSRTFAGIPTPVALATEKVFTWTQPLLRGLGPNASLYDLRNARRARDAQERNLVLTRQRYMVELARVHYQTLAQRELLSVARQSAARSVVLRKASEARLDVGLSNKLDVYRAQLSESQAEQRTVQAETALQDAIEQFHFLLRRPPDDPSEPAPGEIPRASPDEIGPIETLVEIALATRVDLAESRDQIDDARRTASLSRQNLLPDLSVNVRFTEQRGSGAAGPYAATHQRWESFFSASIPLERTADVGQMRLSNLEVTSRQRTYEQRRYEVENEVRSTHRQLLGLSRSIITQQGAVEVADQQLRLANLRYQRGLASNFDVVDAEGSLLAARSALVQLLAAYQVARLDLERVIGRLDIDLGPRP